ncbi:HpcH/HpaI aldolase/citrate lyase family protein [Allopusillimonas soli]|uniref:CoA ester lyase n=1 Tax=Allopusillimonas soli TaxID=659016 RepID=A0A853FBN1_9BURK|nr:CoA ester lyase [Allopusillimonas soli]NYT38175.1 CoA ester lyase [Allopusillimonas soli]
MTLAPEYWRSLLFVPANNPRFIDKAKSVEADAIQLDLEDSVYHTDKDKEDARACIATAAKSLRLAGKTVSVRINQPLDLAVRDIEAAVCEDVSVLALPKIAAAAHVKLIEALVEKCEIKVGMAVGTIQFIVAVETLSAFYQLRSIASSSARIMGLMLGSEDFAWECGCEPSEEVMRGLKQQMIVAAREAGVRPLGYIGSLSNFRNLEEFESMVRRSRAFGFDGATCIHPAQVPIVNRVFGIEEDEFAHAKKVMDNADIARREGKAAFSVDGKMVDKPIIDRAERVLLRARLYRTS